MTSEAAALTEQERERIDKACWQGVALPQLFTAVESILAARLADSRPVVSEGARTDLTAELADMTMDIRIDPETVARVVLGPTVAANIVEVVMRSLPHMGDGA